MARNIVTPISLWLLLAMSSMASAADRPNILLLLAEDMSARVGAFGDAVAVTPNLDATCLFSMFP